MNCSALNSKKPSFRKAMQQARQAVNGAFAPPLTRSEIFQTYRSARDAGVVVLRCTFIDSFERNDKMTCEHSGCNHPEGECSGACLTKTFELNANTRAPAMPTVSEAELNAAWEAFQSSVKVGRAKDGTDIAAVLNERGARYGKFLGHATVTQGLKDMIGDALDLQKKTLAADQAEAIDMICHKLGRIVNGDPNYADSWVDIAGYAKLVADRINGVER